MDVKIDNYFLGGAGFLGAFLSNFTVSTFSRRAVLLGGHTGIMIGMILIYIFIELQFGSDEILFSMVLCILSF